MPRIDTGLQESDAMKNNNLRSSGDSRKMLGIHECGQSEHLKVTDCERRILEENEKLERRLRR